MVSSQIKIPLYDSEKHFVCMIEHAVVVAQSPFFAVVYNRRKHPTRAMITGAPGFMRHLLEDMRGVRMSPRYGMARVQELSTGHVWALAGTAGSKDVDHG